MFLNLTYWVGSRVQATVDPSTSPHCLDIELEVRPTYKAVTGWSPDMSEEVAQLVDQAALNARLGMVRQSLDKPPRLEHIFDKDLRHRDAHFNGQSGVFACYYPRVVWPRTYRVIWPDERRGRIAIFDHGRMQAWDERRRLLDPDGVRIHDVLAPTIWQRLARL